MKRKTDIGLGVDAPEKECDSARCPWHGSLKIRGRTFRGVVSSSKALQTAVVKWDYYRQLHKYERYERRKTSVIVHNPSCISAQPGDTVLIGECRPLSKAKKFVIFSIEKAEQKKKTGKKKGDKQ